jgi:hypothetical protein
MRRCLIVVLLVAAVAAGCGGAKTVDAPSPALQRAVAGRFATALLHGDAAGARALLVRRGDGALEFLVQQAVAPWKGRRASIQLPARRVGKYWAVSFERGRAYKDGTFVRQRGDLVVSVAPSAAGAAVSFFALENLRTRFSTHRDSQLPPSKR